MVDMIVLRLNLVIDEIFHHQMQQAQSEMEISQQLALFTNF